MTAYENNLQHIRKQFNYISSLVIKKVYA